MRNDRPPGSQRPAGEPAYTRPAQQQPSYQQRPPASTVTPAERTPETQRPPANTFTPAARTPETQRPVQTQSTQPRGGGNDRPAAKKQQKRETKRTDK